MGKRAIVVVALGFIGALPGTVLRAADQTRTFNNGTQNWSTSGAWTPAGVPNNGATTYDAIFNGVNGQFSADTLIFNMNAAVQRFTMTGGLFIGPDVGGPFTLTVNEPFAWSGGSIGRANLVLKAGGTIANNAIISLGIGTIENQGRLTYSPTFGPVPGNQIQLQFWLNGGGVLINRNTGTFDITNDGGISVTSGTARIDNEGMWVKSGGTGTSLIMASFNNTGTVRALSGIMGFTGFTQHSASVEAADGAGLLFTGGLHTFHPTAVLGGQGSLQFGGEVAFSGTLTAGAGPLELNNNSQTQFKAGANLAALGLTGPAGRAFRIVGQGSAGFDTGGTVSFANLVTNNNFANTNQIIFLAGSDDLALTGASTWTGGSVIAPTNAAVKTFAVNAPLSISGTGMGLDHRKLENRSTITWTGGHIQAKRNASIDNLAGATFDIRSTDARIEWTPTVGTGAPTFNNAGLLLKSAGTDVIEFNDVRLMNTGTVLIQSGTLRLNYGFGAGGHTDTGVNSGTYEVAAGGTMWVNKHRMDAGSTVRGAGTMVFGGNNNTVAGTYNVTGTTVVYGGLLFEQGAALTSVGQVLNVTPSGGVTFNTGQPVTLNDVIVNAKIDGTDPLIINGTLSGTGTLANSNVTIGGNIEPGNSAGILKTQGNLAMTSSSAVSMEIGGNINDESKPDIRFDVLSAGGALTIDGDLVLKLINGYTPAPSDALAIVLANGPLTGLFDNVAPGARLFTEDGEGSFFVNYGVASAFGNDKVVLSSFQAVPEPASIALAALSTCMLFRRRQRHQ